MHKVKQKICIIIQMNQPIGWVKSTLYDWLNKQIDLLGKINPKCVLSYIYPALGLKTTTNQIGLFLTQCFFRVYCWEKHVYICNMIPLEGVDILACFLCEQLVAIVVCCISGDWQRWVCVRETEFNVKNKHLTIHFHTSPIPTFFCSRSWFSLLKLLI